MVDVIGGKTAYVRITNLTIGPIGFNLSYSQVSVSKNLQCFVPSIIVLN